jgi:exonuclease VII large subunit
MALTREDLDAIKQLVDGLLQVQNRTTQAAMLSLRDELKKENADLRREMNRQFALAEQRFDALEHSSANFEVKVSAKFEEIRDEIRGMRSELKQDIRAAQQANASLINATRSDLIEHREDFHEFRRELGDLVPAPRRPGTKPKRQ